MIENFLHNYSNGIGILGVFFVLFAYFMLHLNKMVSSSLHYSLINLVGSALILVSLCFHLNIASMFIEVAWLLISIFGLTKALLKAEDSH